MCFSLDGSRLSLPQKSCWRLISTVSPAVPTTPGRTATGATASTAAGSNKGSGSGAAPLRPNNGQDTASATTAAATAKGKKPTTGGPRKKDHLHLPSTTPRPRVSDVGTAVTQPQTASSGKAVGAAAAAAAEKAKSPKPKKSASAVKSPKSPRGSSAKAGSKPSVWQGCGFTGVGAAGGARGAAGPTAATEVVAVRGTADDSVQGGSTDSPSVNSSASKDAASGGDGEGSGGTTPAVVDLSEGCAPGDGAMDQDIAVTSDVSPAANGGPTGHKDDGDRSDVAGPEPAASAAEEMAETSPPSGVVQESAVAARADEPLGAGPGKGDGVSGAIGTSLAASEVTAPASPAFAVAAAADATAKEAAPSKMAATIPAAERPEPGASISEGTPVAAANGDALSKDGAVGVPASATAQGQACVVDALGGGVDAREDGAATNRAATGDGASSSSPVHPAATTAVGRVSKRVAARAAEKAKAAAAAAEEEATAALEAKAARRKRRNQPSSSSATATSTAAADPTRKNKPSRSTAPPPSTTAADKDASAGVADTGRAGTSGGRAKSEGLGLAGGVKTRVIEGTFSTSPGAAVASGKPAKIASIFLSRSSGGGGDGGNGSGSGRGNSSGDAGPTATTAAADAPKLAPLFMPKKKAGVGGTSGSGSGGGGGGGGGGDGGGSQNKKQRQNAQPLSSVEVSEV